MALAYTAPTWVNGSGTGISASQLQALSDCMEGLVQGSDKAITNISISGQTITLTFADGSEETGTASGLKGISSIAKTGTSGLVDTYTITFTDGSTTTFTVTNGAQGEAGPEGPQGPQGIQGPAGADGVSPEVTITTITGGHRVNITDEEHPSGQNFDVMDGANAVIPNPQGTPTDTLESININGEIFEIQGGDPNAYSVNDTIDDVAFEDTDKMPFYDDSASAKKNSTWSNIKSRIKAFLDSYYNKTEVGYAGTASSSDVRRQYIKYYYGTSGETSWNVDGSEYFEQTINAQANTDTTFTFSSTKLTYASVLDIFAGCKTADYDIPILKRKTLSVSGATGTLTLVYNVPTAYALTVRVYIRG